MTTLRQAAQAVIERWDSPLWKDVPATAVYISALREALVAPPLPKELAAFAETRARHCALNDMVQAYGQQCQDAALDKAAQVCDAYQGTSLGLADCANEIRRLK